MLKVNWEECPKTLLENLLHVKLNSRIGNRIWISHLSKMISLRLLKICPEAVRLDDLTFDVTRSLTSRLLMISDDQTFTNLGEKMQMRISLGYRQRKLNVNSIACSRPTLFPHKSHPPAQGTFSYATKCLNARQRPLNFHTFASRFVNPNSWHE